MAFTLLKKTTNIDFVGVRRYAYALSLFILLLGALSVVWHGGLLYGVDFAGGVMVQVQFERDVPDQQVKSALADIDLPGLTVQRIGDGGRDYMLRFSAAAEGATENLRANMNSALSQRLPDNPVTIQRLEMVGPKVGSDLRNMAVEALFYSVLLITVYISGRFEYSWFAAGILAAVLWAVVFAAGYTPVGRMWGVAVAMVITVIMTWRLRLNFALGAIVSLLHDVFLTLGLLTLLNREIDLNIIAALLTLVGYSLNDTIIVFDRIRENLRNIPVKTAAADMPSMGSIINKSVNQTLSRTLLTSATTLAACLSLYLLGGSVIHDFALTILLGVLIGTYSSIFVASPILLAFGDVGQYHRSQQAESYEKPGEHGVV
ncbi:MAG: protein translocase subunit SecF [Desulfovibrionaceae bacterium]|nr:protein translocase subunit SecF [Desulfovibrionaceae bacterium]